MYKQHLSSNHVSYFESHASQWGLQSSIRRSNGGGELNPVTGLACTVQSDLCNDWHQDDKMLLVWSNPCRGSWVQPDVLYIYLLVSMCWNDKMYICGWVMLSLWKEISNGTDWPSPRSGRLAGTFLLLSYTSSSFWGFTSLVSHLRSWGDGWGWWVGVRVCGVGRCRAGVLVRGHTVTGAGECGDGGGGGEVCYQRVRQVIVAKVGVRYGCRLGNCQDRDRPLSSHLPRWRGWTVARGFHGQAPGTRRMSSWHWRATAPPSFRCLRACPSLSCRCTGRWRSHLRWTGRPRPPRSPPGCRRSRLGGPSRWTESGSPSAACGPPCH